MSPSGEHCITNRPAVDCGDELSEEQAARPLNVFHHQAMIMHHITCTPRSSNCSFNLACCIRGTRRRARCFIDRDRSDRMSCPLPSVDIFKMSHCHETFLRHSFCLSSFLANLNTKISNLYRSDPFGFRIFQLYNYV